MSSILYKHIKLIKQAYYKAFIFYSFYFPLSMIELMFVTSDYDIIFVKMPGLYYLSVIISFLLVLLVCKYLCGITRSVSICSSVKMNKNKINSVISWLIEMKFVQTANFNFIQCKTIITRELGKDSNKMLRFRCSNIFPQFLSIVVHYENKWRKVSSDK